MLRQRALDKLTGSSNKTVTYEYGTETFRGLSGLMGTGDRNENVCVCMCMCMHVYVFMKMSKNTLNNKRDKDSIVVYAYIQKQ